MAKRKTARAAMFPHVMMFSALTALAWCLLAGCGDGTIGSNTDPACSLSCQDRECGDNGCGGVCGSCATGETCNSATGRCEGGSSCVPACAGVQCGSDGCGGVCGSCATGETCNSATGRCEGGPSCVPACAGVQCGSDGCGGSCPSLCGAGQECLSTGQCSAPGGPPRAWKGLAVIVDFADRRLEDHTGAGIRSQAEIATLVADMESHWAWISRGRETYHWDLARIQLRQSFTQTAFANWSAFRDAVVIRLKQQINPADYDADGDSVIDGVFFVVASGSGYYDYLLGGASTHEGACIFVDAQSSQSLQMRATGNFNHELGHCRGLPDLYGAYSTINLMSLMSNSWELPGNDFSVYDRLHLSWVNPQVITATARDLALPADPASMAGLRVNTTIKDEYFLLEYRRRPASGFGSAGPAFDGLAVYHVLEGSTGQKNPPILSVLPGDGALVPGPLEVTDLFYPENTGMSLPRIFRSYLGGTLVFQLENLRRRAGGGLLFDIVILDGTPMATNLLANPSFEEGSGSPSSWGTAAYDPLASSFSVDTTQVHGGTRSALIFSARANDAEWSQSVTGLTPGAPYLVCGFVKGENIVGYQSQSAGGTVSISGTDTWRTVGFGTFDWTEGCVLTEGPANGTLKPACRLGGYASTASGRLWCDDFTLYQLDKAF